MSSNSASTPLITSVIEYGMPVQVLIPALCAKFWKYTHAIEIFDAFSCFGGF